MIILLLRQKILKEIFLHKLNLIKLIQIILFLNNHLLDVLLKFFIIRKAVRIISTISPLVGFLITFGSRLTLSLFLLLIYIKLNFLFFLFLIKVKVSHFTLFLSFSCFHIRVYFLEVKNYPSDALNLIFRIKVDSVGLCCTICQLAAFVYIFLLELVVA